MLTDPTAGERDTRPMHGASRTRYVLGGVINKTCALMIAVCDHINNTFFLYIDMQYGMSPGVSWFV